MCFHTCVVNICSPLPPTLLPTANLPTLLPLLSPTSIIEPCRFCTHTCKDSNVSFVLCMKLQILNYLWYIPVRVVYVFAAWVSCSKVCRIVAKVLLVPLVTVFHNNVRDFDYTCARCHSLPLVFSRQPLFNWSHIYRRFNDVQPVNARMNACMWFDSMFRYNAEPNVYPNNTSLGTNQSFHWQTCHYGQKTILFAYN